MSVKLTAQNFLARFARAALVAMTIMIVFGGAIFIAQSVLSCTSDRAASFYDATKQEFYYDELNESTSAKAGGIDDTASDDFSTTNAPGGAVAQSSNTDEKVIKSGVINLTVDDVDAAYNAVVGFGDAAGAKVDQMSISDDRASITLRVPSERFDSVCNDIVEWDNAESDMTVWSTDSTKQYSDNSRRIEALQLEYDELKALLTQAQSIDEVITVRDRLTEVDYEMRMYEEANAGIDYDVEWSTLNVTIAKTHIPGTIEKSSFWEELRRAFSDGWEMLLGAILALVSLWWLFAIALLMALVIVVYKRKRANKKIAQNTQNEETCNDYD